MGQILKVMRNLSFHWGSTINENHLLEVLKAMTKMALRKLTYELSSPH